MKVSIILLNYNGYKDTIECIDSIKQNEKEMNYEIIVVDNKSTDNSVEELKKIDEIILLESERNGGFAYGNNIGIKYAIDKGAEYILLLNNDTIIELNCISLMYKILNENDDMGMIGCRIMYYNNKELINYMGGEINWFKGIVVVKDKLTIYKENNRSFSYTNFITGCCMLIKKEVIDKAGYLPEDYFMYYEDVEYCVKVKDAGYKLGICYNAVIYHKESASSGRHGLAIFYKVEYEK
ncbi:MAG: glycosyltransferase family 2 protein [Oscillospiraceae bacterium]|nr:glycosyltransferase family 2 protein [Oscillospiraceae bacterium]